MIKRIIFLFILMVLPLRAELYDGWDEDSGCERAGKTVLGTTIAIVAIPIFALIVTIDAASDDDDEDDDHIVELENFIKFNYHKVARDMACGKGECLTTIAEMLNKDPQEVGPLLQENFDNIYNGSDMRPEKIAENIFYIAE